MTEKKYKKRSANWTGATPKEVVYFCHKKYNAKRIGRHKRDSAKLYILTQIISPGRLERLNFIAWRFKKMRFEAQNQKKRL